MTDWLAANLAQRAARREIDKIQRRQAEPAFVVSCGNVFADLGLPDADRRLAEADARFAAMCPVCDAAECDSALCEAKRRKAEQQAKLAVLAARHLGVGL